MKRKRDAFILGAEYRYAPRLTTDKEHEHVQRVGVFLSYSVPFFDLN